MKGLKLSQVKIRRAVPSDKGPVVEFCKNIWHGGDYLPGVWDEWLSDRKGLLLVATIHGAPVGVVHAYFQTKDVAWLEGLRVHPAHRGLGIAGKLNRALTRSARSKGAKVARLCTGSSNMASQKHARKLGFKAVQTFQRLDSTRSLRRKPVGVARPRKVRAGLWKWLQDRPEFHESKSMFSDGWTWYPLTAVSFRRLLNNRQVLLTMHNSSPSSCCIVSGEDQRLTLGFAAGVLGDVENVARFLRYMLFRGRHERVRALVPLKSGPVRVLEDNGFEKTAKILVYEKSLR